MAIKGKPFTDAQYVPRCSTLFLMRSKQRLIRKSQKQALIEQNETMNPLFGQCTLSHVDHVIFHWIMSRLPRLRCDFCSYCFVTVLTPLIPV